MTREVARAARQGARRGCLIRPGLEPDRHARYTSSVIDDSPIERACRLRAPAPHTGQRGLLSGATRPVGNRARARQHGILGRPDHSEPVAPSRGFTALGEAPVTACGAERSGEPLNPMLRALERAIGSCFAWSAPYSHFERRGASTSVPRTLDQRREQIGRDDRPAARSSQSRKPADTFHLNRVTVRCR